MDKSVGILVIMFIVAVSGQEYDLTMNDEYVVEQHQTPSSNEVARMIKRLAIGIQRIQMLSTEDRDDKLFCVVCEEMMTLLYSVSTDKELLDLLQKVERQVACTYLFSEGFKSYCEDFVDDIEIPDLLKAFANTYLWAGG
ncbi:uncharacterized protein LOC119740547 [Patiria miniata]|uniref:Saposin B-type domain-containing protein n=1 Tax=Patiria miniata TaxID=46514 RepID=A0A914B7N8_PATMI|nr:uncharacterized protein LOC119740547 [Patiria miniata]